MPRPRKIKSFVLLCVLTFAEIPAYALYVDVQYVSGCRRHDFELTWNGTYAESNPPIATMRLVHKGNGDACEGMIRESLHIALPVVDPCVIRIETGSGQKLDVPHNLA